MRGDADLLASLLQRLGEAVRRPMRIMEVCGTHTHSFFRHGLHHLVPPELQLISGPGCPVCVTSQADIDGFISLAEEQGRIVATFGDMMRVPGSRGSLAQARAMGASVEVVYSPADALKMARENPRRQVVFLAVGFETTAPLVAATVQQAKLLGVENFFIAASLKTMIPALDRLLEREGQGLDGLLLPGHVSTIIGAGAYGELAERHRIPMVVAGFEPEEMLLGLLTLCRMASDGETGVRNCYPSAVTEEGNIQARRTMEEVFEPADARWRGLGIIPGSGLRPRAEYGAWSLGWEGGHGASAREPAGCRCGEVLVGRLNPDQCPLFMGRCTPDHPVGPCMVSSEGTCSAYAMAALH